MHFLEYQNKIIPKAYKQKSYVTPNLRSLIQLSEACTHVCILLCQVAEQATKIASLALGIKPYTCVRYKGWTNALLWRHQWPHFWTKINWRLLLVCSLCHSITVNRKDKCSWANGWGGGKLWKGVGNRADIFVSCEIIHITQLRLYYMLLKPSLSSFP